MDPSMRLGALYRVCTVESFGVPVGENGVLNLRMGIFVAVPGMVYVVPS
jgi:hypothetical protein